MPGALFKENGQVRVLNKDISIVRSKLILFHYAVPLLCRKLRKGFFDIFDSSFFHHERNQVGLRKITVIMSFFLAAHGKGYPARLIPKPCFLNDLLPGFERCFMAPDFMFEANFRSMMFWIEIGVGVIIPTFLFLSHRLRRNPVWLFSAAAMVVFGVVLNRFNVFITGYIPPYSQGQYFPAWTEVMLTVGMISLIVLFYRAWVFIFPILPDEEEVEHA